MTLGDFVVFFCGRETDEGGWEYFYVGVGTVGRLLNRHEIWEKDNYEPYRQFFNVLARSVDGVLQQHETIHGFHVDWERRAAAPYIMFDADQTRFDLHTPLHVASYDPLRGGIETWHERADRVRRVAELVLPDPPTRRGLRSVNLQRSHPKMNLGAQAHRAGGFESLRRLLLELVDG